MWPLISSALLSVAAGERLRQAHQASGLFVPVTLLPSAAVLELAVGSDRSKFTALIDTGSGNLVVPSSSCSAPGCRGHRKFAPEDDEGGRLTNGTANSAEVELNYAGAKVMGNAFESGVCLGSACGRASFVVAAFESDTFHGLPFDAVLGLGPKSLALNPHFAVLGSLQKGTGLASSSFVLSLRVGSASRLGLGDAAQAESWLAVDRRHGEWAVALQGVYLGGKRTSACGKDGCRAVLDTGCPKILLPGPAFKELSEKLHLESDGCPPAAELPSLLFALDEDGATHEVKPERYLRQEDGRCVPLLASAADFGTRTAVLGLPFFLDRDVAFDQEQLRVGLAKGKVPATPAAPAASVPAGGDGPLARFLKA